MAAVPITVHHHLAGIVAFGGSIPLVQPIQGVEQVVAAVTAEVSLRVEAPLAVAATAVVRFQDVVVLVLLDMG